jgi:hypothetical protein
VCRLPHGEGKREDGQDPWIHDSTDSINVDFRFAFWRRIFSGGGQDDPSHRMEGAISVVWSMECESLGFGICVPVIGVQEECASVLIVGRFQAR